MNKFPIRIPNNLNLTVVQPFHVRTPVDESKALNTQPVDHLGVDVVCGTPEQTWRTECVWPFPWPGTVYDAQVDSLFGAKLHAHSQIDGTDPATGIQYSLIYLHLSSVTHTKTDTDPTVITYNQGDVIGKIGNNGAVNPLPTPARPLDGTHLHLGVGIKNPGEQNFTMTDPLLYLDPNDPFRSTKFIFTKNLWLGQSNTDVLELQKRLAVKHTSFFGPLTLAAVTVYQHKHSIPATGFVGSLTRAALNT